MLVSLKVCGRFSRRYAQFRGFIGTTVRGALGLVLRRISCRVEGEADCRGCKFYRDCPYALLYESSSLQNPGVDAAAKRGLEGVTNPFTVEVLGVDQSRVRFAVNLFGRAVGLERHVLASIVGMGLEGLGFDASVGERRRFVVERIDRLVPESGEDVVLYTEGSGYIPSEPRFSARSLLEVFERRARDVVEARPGKILLFFLSPFRLVVGDRVLDRPPLEAVLMNLARRYSLLAAYHGAGRPLDKPTVRGLKALARLARLEGALIAGRVSAGKVSLAGERKRYGSFVRAALSYRVSGEFWSGEQALLAAELLLLGEYLHVGKLASAGYGDYELYFKQ